MGLSIHYRGNIKNEKLIDPLIEEVKDICESLDWEYDVFDDDTFKGISFAPNDCEPVFLTFNKIKQLSSPILYQYDIEPATIISVKTQFAGTDAHIAIINLFRYLENLYFDNFHMDDEGNYWESGDEAALQLQFKKYNTFLNLVENTLKEMKEVPGETKESLVFRINAIIQKKMNDLKYPTK